jgi:hypothetical protein
MLLYANTRWTHPTHSNCGLNLQTSDRPSVLLVAQPDTLPTVRGEVKVIQALESSLDINLTSWCTGSLGCEHGL